MKEKFINDYIDFYTTILGPAVKREANIDITGLGENKIEQEKYENYIFGIIIIGLYSFIESNYGKFRFDKKNTTEKKYYLGEKSIEDKLLIESKVKCNF